MNDRVQIALFAVIAALLSAAYLVYVFYAPLKRFAYKHWPVRAFYRQVNAIALDGDYYLINDYVGQSADGSPYHIDHVLIGDKYVYCLRDRYYAGTLLSRLEDPYWVYYEGKRSRLVPNPMVNNALRAERLRLRAPFPSSRLLSLVLVNDDCFYAPFAQNDETGYFISLSHLESFIEAREAEDLPSLDPATASYFAKELHEDKSHA